MRLLAAALLATLTTACVTKGRFTAKEAEAAGYRSDLAAESRRRADLEERAAAQQERIAALEKERGELQGRLAAATGNLSERERALAEATARGQELEASLQQTRSELDKRSSEFDELSRTLKDEIARGQIELSELQGRMTVKLKDRILFSSGSATIGREGRDALAKVAEAFRNLGGGGRIVRVEGHTDDRPIGNAVYPSNWELSSARALAVVRFLQENGVSPQVLAAAAYSEYRPVAGNDTPDGRSLNRRIEIVLAPAEPGPGADPSPPAAPDAAAAKEE